jgi:signal transduction histidine kinase
VCSYSPVRGEDGEIIGVVSIVQEITERRQAEEARLQFSRELDEKNRELESLVYVASHDLRSPLVNIEGFGQELSRSCAEIQKLLQSQSSHIQPEALAKLTRILDVEIPEALHFIQVSATKMDVLLAGLLKLSRLGRQPLSLQRVDMNALMAAVLAGMEFQIQQAGAAVAVEELPPCLGDENQLNQLFTNILDNSLKYRHPSRRCSIRIAGSEEETRVIYCIEDNGVGIPPGQLEKVFELFYRLQPRETAGEGLGLTIAQRIATRHQGSISIESKLDVGSNVSVFLPRHGAAVTAGKI